MLTKVSHINVSFYQDNCLRITELHRSKKSPCQPHLFKLNLKSLVKLWKSLHPSRTPIELRLKIWRGSLLGTRILRVPSNKCSEALLPGDHTRRLEILISPSTSFESHSAPPINKSKSFEHVPRHAKSLKRGSQFKPPIEYRRRWNSIWKREHHVYRRPELASLKAPQAERAGIKFTH